MNFEYMPELDFKFGYFVALALMAIATAVPVRLRSRAGMTRRIPMRAVLMMPQRRRSAITAPVGSTARPG